MNDKDSGKIIRKPILALSKADFPDFTTDQLLSIAELNLYRERYVFNDLSYEIVELSKIKDAVFVEFLESDSMVSKMEEKLGVRTFGW